MTRNILLSTALIATLALPSLADVEVTGELKGELSVFTKDNVKSKNGTINHKRGNALKEEGTLKLFFNGDVGEDSSFHAGFNLVKDWKGINHYDGHRSYTQQDYVREMYLDTTYGDWDLRLGKQQLVWGTADGVKFLDIINPTDFREWGQNTMEDSRIPLWMAVAEKDLGNNNSIQIVWVPDVGRINQIAGLEDTGTGDQNQPFVSLGAETMTGQRNGFLNIAPALGQVAATFSTDAVTGVLHPGSLGGLTDPADGAQVVGDKFITSTVQEYVDNQVPGFRPVGGATSATSLKATAERTNQEQTNLIDSNWDANNPNSVFEYMADTTFATFTPFINMTSEYRIDEKSRRLKNHNLGLRYKASTNSGLNYSLNYYYHWDNNPVANMHWEDQNGNTLTSKTSTITGLGANTGTNADTLGKKYTTVRLINSDGSLFDRATQGATNLVFEQSLNRVNTFGASFDYGLDTSFAPIVIRGEFVYDKGSKVPEVNLGKLAYGDIVGSMTMADADIFKYVIGADVTLGKNLFTSLQFMDTWNLDYVDKTEANLNGDNYSTFTANPATLSLTNGFKKAQEHQIMYTLFLSKPFLEGESLRVNNLFLYEQEDGGYWNRLDAEYSYSDDIVLTGEWNAYGGDKNGVFGQFEDMSNLQVGVKYIF